MSKAIINLDTLGQNLRRIKQLAPGTGVVAMVKANAYGHGIVEISRYLTTQGIEALGVATLDEAILLRENQIQIPILLMGGAGLSEFVDLIVKHQIIPLVSSLDELVTLSNYAKKQNILIEIHIDIDTGMSRAGFLVDDLPDLSHFRDTLNITGVSTHFANAETDDCPYTLKQIKKFSHALKQLNLQNPIIHTSKSSAIVHHFNTGHWIRPGIALYDGILTWQAPITLLKHLPQGTPVGYGNTWIAPRDTTIALLRVGYADGYNRLLSNQGYVLINGQKAMVVGRISMDLCTVDVTDVSCRVGDFATLLGEGLSANQLADICQTISYEVLTSISTRVKREYQGGTHA